MSDDRLLFSAHRMNVFRLFCFDAGIVDETVGGSITSTVSIDLSPSIFKSIGDQEDVGLVFTYYETGSLFPPANDTRRETVVATAVIGALIANKNISKLDDSELVNITLPLLHCVRIELRSSVYN